MRFECTKSLFAYVSFKYFYFAQRLVSIFSYYLFSEYSDFYSHKSFAIWCGHIRLSIILILTSLNNYLAKIHGSDEICLSMGLVRKGSHWDLHTIWIVYGNAIFDNHHFISTDEMNSFLIRSGFVVLIMLPLLYELWERDNFSFLFGSIKCISLLNYLFVVISYLALCDLDIFALFHDSILKSLWLIFVPVKDTIWQMFKSYIRILTHHSIYKICNVCVSSSQIITLGLFPIPLGKYRHITSCVACSSIYGYLQSIGQISFKTTSAADFIQSN